MPHIHGIRKRWMLNSILITALVVFISVLTFSIILSNYYYSNMRSSLEAKANTATDFFTNYVTKTYAEYYDSAYKYTSTFEDSSRLELQFINTKGKVEISSYGITAGTSPGTLDVSQAIASGEISTWLGKAPAQASAFWLSRPL